MTTKKLPEEITRKDLLNYLDTLPDDREFDITCSQHWLTASYAKEFLGLKGEFRHSTYEFVYTILPPIPIFEEFQSMVENFTLKMERVNLTVSELKEILNKAWHILKSSLDYIQYETRIHYPQKINYCYFSRTCIRSPPRHSN